MATSPAAGPLRFVHVGLLVLLPELGPAMDEIPK